MSIFILWNLNGQYNFCEGKLGYDLCTKKPQNKQKHYFIEKQTQNADYPHVNLYTRPCIRRFPASRGGARAAERCVHHSWALGGSRCGQSAAGPPPDGPPLRPGAVAGYLSHPRGSHPLRVRPARTQSLGIPRVRRRASRWDRRPGRANSGVRPPRGVLGSGRRSPTSPPARHQTEHGLQMTKDGLGWDVCVKRSRILD